MSAPASNSCDLSLSKSPPSTATLLAQRIPKPYINSLCGAAAGVASGIITCPLDVIKTKLQAQGSFRHQQHSQGAPTTSQVYRGLVGTARTIIRQDGLKGMYRGLGPMILGYLPTWAVYMSIYDIAKTKYSERIGEFSTLNLVIDTY